MPNASHTTQLLLQAGNGDKAAADKLLPLVYDELRALAQHYMEQERTDHTLQATAVVHEAYLRLVDQRKANWNSRAHFMAMAAQMIRRILVDHARRRLTTRRNHNGARRSLTNNDISFEATDEGLIELDESLERLKKLSERQARIVELRFFGGLTIEETADMLNVSSATVKNDWRIARAWLSRELRR